MRFEKPGKHIFLKKMAEKRSLFQILIEKSKKIVKLVGCEKQNNEEVLAWR